MVSFSGMDRVEEIKEFKRINNEAKYHLFTFKCYFKTVKHAIFVFLKFHLRLIYSLI